MKEDQINDMSYYIDSDLEEENSEEIEEEEEKDNLTGEDEKN